MFRHELKEGDHIMQPSTRLDGDPASILSQSTRAEDGGDSHRLERTGRSVASRDVFDGSIATAAESGFGLKGDDGIDGVLEIEFQDWIALIASAKAGYQLGDTACEADFRAAFLLDARLTVSEFIRELKRELRNDISDLVHDCRHRLVADPGDVVSLSRLGLTLLLLYQDENAFLYLQRAFVHHPLWRPMLRALVNKAKLRREDVLDFILGREPMSELGGDCERL
jgi:hypothetical protein